MDRAGEKRAWQAARKGDQDAFLAIFDAHHAPLYRFAYRLTKSQQDAEEIVQECFLGLLQRQNGFDPDRTALRTYLFGAVRNQASKRFHSREREAADETGAVAAGSPEDCAAQTELCEAVKKAVSGLSLAHQEVIILAHFEQWPLADVAELLGIDIGAVKMRLRRARAALKEALAAYRPRDWGG